VQQQQQLVQPELFQLLLLLHKLRAYCCCQVRGMVKHFNTAKGVFRAVDGVDVDIPPSSICALLGPSGSGEQHLQ
jgi:ABC-type glutathione transport system ATPase component